MTIRLNNESLKLPSEITTIAERINWRKINPEGTAIAIDDNLIKREAWAKTLLKEKMNITVISAAFGG